MEDNNNKGSLKYADALFNLQKGEKEHKRLKQLKKEEKKRVWKKLNEIVKDVNGEEMNFNKKEELILE
jgi:hypothetical protein